MTQPGRAARLAGAVRDGGGTCLWCRRPFSPLVPATTDHVVPRVRGGPSWTSNEVAACRRCNGQRGHTAPVEWLQECQRRGWVPDADALARALDGLAAEIDARGGQRRARPYLDGQRRRLARLHPAAAATGGGAGGPGARPAWQTPPP